MDPMTGQQPLSRLTERQQEVLELLSDGLTMQAIAHRLGLSPRTVGKHLERVYRRLGTSDRLMTVMRAQRDGLLVRRAMAGDTP
jgi:DNA-binding NarL/FixJ family response regulator